MKGKSIDPPDDGPVARAETTRQPAGQGRGSHPQKGGKSHDVQRICNDGQADAGHHPAPVEYIAEELGGEKFKTVCDDIYAVLKENELSVEQAEVMLEVVKARLKKIAKI